MIGVKKTSQQGFALFLTIVIMGIILAATIATVDIGVKEYLLSGGDRESQQAFYATDRALECTMYADFAEIQRSNRSGFDYVDTAAGESELPNAIKCAGYVPNSFSKTYSTTKLSNATAGNRSVATTTFSLNYSLIDPTYKGGAEVTVARTAYPDDTGIDSRTLIMIRGYNTTDPNNPRRVERAIRLQY